MMELKKILSRTTFTGNRVSLVPHKGSITDFFPYFSEQDIFYMFGIKPPYTDAVIRKKDREPWSAISDIICNETQTLCGFIHFVIHHDINREISVHGSGINKSIGHVRSYVDGWNLAIDVCKNDLICSKISSYCNQENRNAINILLKTRFFETSRNLEIITFNYM